MSDLTRQKFTPDNIEGEKAEVEIINIIETNFKAYDEKGNFIIFDRNNKKGTELTVLKKFDFTIHHPSYGSLLIECKCDRKAHETQNIAIEFRDNNGNPSGIETSQAPLFVYKLKTLNEYLVFSTDKVRNLIKEKKYFMESKSDEGASIYLFRKETIVKNSENLYYMKRFKDFIKLSRNRNVFIDAVEPLKRSTVDNILEEL